MQYVQKIISLVQEKKEYQFLGEGFISWHVQEQLRLDKKMRQTVESLSEEQFEKNKVVKQLVKYVREKARKIYGVFQVPTKLELREEFLLEGKGDVEDVLQSHLSTKERVPYYSDFFKQIFAKTQKPTAILDVACGMNPVAFFMYTEYTDTQYDCNELSEKDANQLQQYLGNRGIAKGFDVVKHTGHLASFGREYSHCFLLKALDTCESQRKYVTYDIIKHINATWFIVSFPLQNVKGIQMQRDAQIHWFEKMCPRLDLSFETIAFPGEVVYLCKKD